MRSTTVILALCLCLGMLGCAADQGTIHTKGGEQYGVTDNQVWRDTWWQNYERGLSYAAGEFWDDAVVSFQRALATKLGQQDRQSVTTYGVRSLEHYFPHRELGIAYYRLGRYQEALHELTTSIDQTASAKAKFYLNKVRRSLLQQTGRDTTPPRLVLTEPVDGLLTNRFSVTVAGHVEDDTYTAGLTINGQAQLIDLAAPRVAFTTDVALHDGPNTIAIVAEDLLGQRTTQRVTVSLDRHGPLLSLQEVDLHGTPPHQQARLQGVVADTSRIVRFVVAGQPLDVSTQTTWGFRQEFPVSAGATSLPFVAEDEAGNVTRGDIQLGTSVRDAQHIPQERGLPTIPARWAFASQGTVLSDLVAGPDIPWHLAQSADRDPPRITLTSSVDRETVYDDKIYLEGRVTGTSEIATFFIAGESYLKYKGRQIFFGYLAPLRAGPNGFRLEAVDVKANRGTLELQVTYQAQQSRQFGTPLQVLLLPFAKIGRQSILSEAVPLSLFAVLGTQKRFEVISEGQTSIHKGLSDPRVAVNVGKARRVDAVLMGTVVEGEQVVEGAKRPILTVYSQLVDVETGKNLVQEEVFGEYPTLPEVSTLMEGLALKLQRHFPREEGRVIDKKKTKLAIEFPNHQRLQPGMKFLIFRDGETIDRNGKKLQKSALLLGEAQLQSYSPHLVEAILLPSKKSGDININDKVILK